MCDFVTPILTAIGIGGGATAAGATAAASTAAAGASIGTTLQAIGTIAGLAGTLYQGAQTQKAYEAQATQIEQQQRVEAQLSATEEQRSRQQFAAQISRQRADLVARGISLDSPTAVFLGQTAAREMVFEAQSIRQGGFATSAELSAQARAARARGRNAAIKGGFSAASGLLTSAPDLWPELLS